MSLIGMAIGSPQASVTLLGQRKSFVVNSRPATSYSIKVGSLSAGGGAAMTFCFDWQTDALLRCT